LVRVVRQNLPDQFQMVSPLNFRLAGRLSLAGVALLALLAVAPEVGQAEMGVALEAEAAAEVDLGRPEAEAEAQLDTLETVVMAETTAGLGVLAGRVLEAAGPEAAGAANSIMPLATNFGGRGTWVAE
jgi:hypothetical protein